MLYASSKYKWMIMLKESTLVCTCVCVMGYAHELLDKTLILASSVHCILKWTLLLYNASGKVQAEKTAAIFLENLSLSLGVFPNISEPCCFRCLGPRRFSRLFQDHLHTHFLVQSLQ